MATLSPKEADYLSDLMTYESILCKKCEYYGKTVFDKSLSNVFTDLSAQAKKRFSELYGEI